MIVEQRFTNTSSKPIMMEEVSRNWMELLNLNEGKLIILSQEMNNSDEINNFFMNNHQNKIGIFVKLISNVSMRWKNFLQFKSQESMNIREEDWSKIRTLLMNSRPEFTNYRMKSIVWMTRETLRMPSQYAVDHPTFPVNQRYFQLLSRSNQPPDIWNSHGISGNVFVNPDASSSSPYPGEFNPWICNVTHITACNEWTSKPRHSFESEISVRTVSRDFIRS